MVLDWLCSYPLISGAKARKKLGNYLMILLMVKIQFLLRNNFRKKLNERKDLFKAPRTRMVGNP